MQNPLKLLYPDQCVACGALVDGEVGLCAACWADTGFLDGLTCDACALPLIGRPDGARPLCDACLAEPPPWDRGRAVFSYGAAGRRIVLALKHGDRLDLARPAARWMATRGRTLFQADTALVPVPIHWTRLLKRRFNQSAVLAREIARLAGLDYRPQALVRARRSRPQEHMTRAERLANQNGSIAVDPAGFRGLRGRPVVLIDDVITSGATLGEASRVLHAAGAGDVSVLALARVVKDS